MLIFLLLSLLIRNGITKNSVYIREYPESVLTCIISGPDADKSTPYLHCPLIKSEMCFSNCTGGCEFINGKCAILEALKPIYDCKYRLYSSDHVEIQYYIQPQDIINIKGEWFCSFAGINSKAIVLKMSDIQSTTTTTSKPIIDGGRNKFIYTPAIAKVQKLTDKADVIELPTAVPKAKDIVKQSSSDDDLSFKSFITRFQVVLGILCLFALSIVLNIVFCIRDSLVKYYIENVKNNLASNKFLLFCICQRDSIQISATARLDRILSQETNYSKSDPPNSQTNINEYDQQTMLLSKQSNFNNEIIPSPMIGRARSFQCNTPLMLQRSSNPYYMSMPRGYPVYNYGAPSNSQGVLIGNGSINGSETFQEDVSPQCLYQFDNQGNAIPVRFISNNSAINRQSIDLINDCDPKISESASNVSK